jgi:hypothetical protein
MKITLSYQPQQLQPPNAYAAVLQCVTQDHAIEAKFDLEYLGRESISKEELKAEGFTENDDYSWKGNIDLGWKKDIISFATMDILPEPDNEIYLHIEVDDVKKGFAKNIDEADVLFQEILQAIIEQDQIEAPLDLKIKLNGREYEVIWNFSKRSIIVNKVESIGWESGRKIMHLIFSPDYGSMAGSSKPPNDGVYLDGSWYPISNDVKQELMINLKNL